ncbi:flagellin [Mesorhizobium sp. 1B3]|uniref:flagellin N-terminal helical domain-containing protein n=1 Tax=Mesorhizobium sp. 1B3 TaxID=3243599 RepID=UPI003D98C1BB
MSSILTNVSAMTALKSLQSTNKNLEATQNRISTGLRVAEAQDNAAYWSIATSMRSDNSSLSTVKDALGFGAAQVDTAYTGTNAAHKVVTQIKDKIISAMTPGLDKAKIQSEIKELQGQLKSIADSASFAGENWLSVKSDADDYTANKEIVASFTRGAGGNISVGTLTIDTSQTKLFDATAASGTGAVKGLLDSDIDIAAPTGSAPAYSAFTFSIATLDVSTIDADALEAVVNEVVKVAGKLETSAATLGAAKTRIDLQNEFIGSLRDAIDRGVGTLVDADMNEESTRLQALQVQQQLGIQALSIANGNSQQILSLFR